MKRIITIAMLWIPLMTMAQTDITAEQQRVEELKAEAAAKAQAAKEAAEAAQAAAKAAEEAAKAAAAEAERLAKEKPSAQSPTGWDVPTEQETATGKSDAPAAKTETEEAYKYADYIVEGCVPTVDGKVQWTYDLDVPGKNAEQIYTSMLDILTRMTQEDNQLERSKVALVNPNEHRIIATMQEWLVFTSSLMALDRTKFNYVLQVNCSDGHVQILLDHITYNYESQNEKFSYKAEEWITDEFAVNKKRTRLFPISGKFRRKTIDRKNEIFKNIKAAVL